MQQKSINAVYKESNDMKKGAWHTPRNQKSQVHPEVHPVGTRAIF